MFLFQIDIDYCRRMGLSPESIALIILLIFGVAMEVTKPMDLPWLVRTIIILLCFIFVKVLVANLFKDQVKESSDHNDDDEDETPINNGSRTVAT